MGKDKIIILRRPIIWGICLPHHRESGVRCQLLVTWICCNTSKERERKCWRKNTEGLCSAPRLSETLNSLLLHYFKTVLEHEEPLHSVVERYNYWFKKKKSYLFWSYYRLMCNRHHLMGHKGSEGHYSLAGQDPFEGFKVCGSLLSSWAAQATPAHRKARGDFWEQQLLMHFHTQIKPNHITEKKFRTCRHGFCHSHQGVHP